MTRERFAGALLEWYDEFGRHDLPWQIDATPYRVWVSEIMLQQTQVRTVIPYFERFTDRFPSVGSLASAELDEVLKLWSGLGYYARARNLHRAAGIVVEDFDGEVPASVDALMALPGIGRSTAGAIAALSFDTRAPILDGNVKRVLTRYHAIEGWSGLTIVSKRLWDLAERYTPTRRVAAYTQAIMDLGSTVCVRGKPQCVACPVESNCRARELGIEETLPSPRPRRARPRREVTMLLVADPNDRVLLARRPENGVWGGLYSFPELTEDEDSRFWCDRHLGVGVEKETTLDPLQHAFTHFDLSIRPVLIQLAGAPRALMDGKDWLWYNPAQEIEVGVAAPVAELLDTFRGEESLRWAEQSTV